MEKLNSLEYSDASIVRKSGIEDKLNLHGSYNVVCLDKNGNKKWEDKIGNIVTTAGRNHALDSELSGSNYTATSYIGLISSVSYSGSPTIDDTMGSHGTWYEVSAITYFPTVAARQITSWAGATSGSKTLASSASFSIITNGGTVKGCFLVIGTGASATLADTGGVLFSAGVFNGGDKTVSTGDTLNVTYTAGF
jgi:hypothetical protein